MDQLVSEYQQNTNIMELLRTASGSDENSAEAILVSYDLQSGSYSEMFRTDAEFRAHKDHINRGMADVLGALSGHSLLEVGVGEASTLGGVAQHLRTRFPRIGGFDIAWSRIAYAREHLRSLGLDAISLWTGNLTHIPLVDNAFDVVYTAHSLEPNGGKERECLQELYRVTAEWLVLLEPADELGNEETRQRIERHGYCRGLAAAARDLGYEIVDYRLFEHTVFNQNQSHQIIIRKPRQSAAAAEAYLGCPVCTTALVSHAGNYFCPRCLRVYPVIQGLPCLLPENGVLATKYLSFSEEEP